MSKKAFQEIEDILLERKTTTLKNFNDQFIDIKLFAAEIT